MKVNIQTLRNSIFSFRIVGLLVALTCAVAFIGCSGGSTNAEAPKATVGSLNVNVNPGSAKVAVTGPNNFSQASTGSQLITNLEPGQYSVAASAPTFGDEASQINVVAGQTSSLSLVLMSTAAQPAALTAALNSLNGVLVSPTLGSLNINIIPASAKVVVTGPDSFTQTNIGNQLLSDLKPGQYKMIATAPAFGDGAGQINVVAGQTSTISIILQPTPIIAAAPRAVYRNGDGNLIPINSTVQEPGKFVFYAWGQDNVGGITPGNLMSPVVSDPGKPLISEQTEIAPSFTQNLVGAWVGFKDATGVVRPVIGADVRWEIDQMWKGRVHSMQFGTSDDNRSALGYGVFDDQADTRTNNARLNAERFPLVETEYSLYNRTGIGTPFADGFTWVTLFSPDSKASSRIVAVATVNGEEIGKQIIYKKFAPTPKLEIKKTVSSDIVNLVGGVASVDWTVIVKNVGNGEATNIDLADVLASGAGANYSLSSLPITSIPVGDGFTYSFPLDSVLAPLVDNTKTMTFTATVTAPGTYCNEAQIISYKDDNKTWIPVDLNSQACFTALESNVSIIKDFVATDNITSLGKTQTVSVNTPARLRVRVINSGTGVATGAVVNDQLTSGNLATYQLLSVSSGTPNLSGGFDSNIGDLAVGVTSTLIFNVMASVDGKYCDTATVTATSGIIGIGSDTACLTVATPNLEITKINDPKNVLPSANYTSTIVVQNNGNATAKNIVISDALGLNSAANVRVIYVSSSLNGAIGTLSNNVVTTSNTIDILAGESLTFTVVSRIPFGGASGSYCNTATVTSSNSTSKQATDCVDVPAFSALQTQLVDLDDPVAVNNNATYFSALYVEAISNEGVKSNKMKYSFGLVNPTIPGIAGIFQESSTNIYLDPAPVRDPVTGLVISDTSSPTAVLLTAGSDYTVDDSTVGLQLIEITSSVVLRPDTAFYVVHETLVPSWAPVNKMYTTSYIWDSIGSADPTHIYKASSSEVTTVLP